jgi:DNA topoisomerase VI subunit A
MTEIYINLVKGQVRTKRDLFYGNTVLFKKQTILDSAIRTLAKALSVPRDALNVIGAGKGLYFGEIMIDDQKISSKNVNLIPRREDVMNLDLLDTRFILVIEKDAVMNVIVDNYNHIKTILGSFLIVCGKGFPCLRTKQFLNLIQQNYPKLPKYILVDNDPFGIDIALNYVSSTEVINYLISNLISLFFKNEMDSCPSLEYFGVDHFDIDKYGNPSMTESLNPTDLRRLETVKTRAKSLKRFKELDEIKFMQNNRKKAEMECLYNPDSTAFCTKFLLDKLQGVLPSKMEEGTL